MKEKDMVETNTSDMRVVDIEHDGMSVRLLVEADERDVLVENGRRFCVDHAARTPDLAGWATGGVEPASGPMAVDPDDPEKDSYEAAAEAKKAERKIAWKYRQWFQLTKML